MSESIAESVNRIRAWLSSNAPELNELFAPGASEAELADLEKSIGTSLPDDLKQSLLVFNGAYESGILPSSDSFDMMAFSPLSVDLIKQNWLMLKELITGGEFEGRTSDAEDGIQTDWWNVMWIPFADNGGGDFQCIDLAPTETGKVGQVIGAWHADSERQLIAPSLSEYLQALADGLEEGQYTYDEEYGIVQSDE